MKKLFFLIAVVSMGFAHASVCLNEQGHAKRFGQFLEKATVPSHWNYVLASFKQPDGRYFGGAQPLNIANAEDQCIYVIEYFGGPGLKNKFQAVIQLDQKLDTLYLLSLVSDIDGGGSSFTTAMHGGKPLFAEDECQK